MIDKWQSATSAMKSFKKDNKLTEGNLRHEIVNHSAGELVNQNGVSTNAIDRKWSVTKRGSEIGCLADYRHARTVRSGLS